MTQPSERKWTPEPWDCECGSVPLADTGDYTSYFNVYSGTTGFCGNLIAKLDFTRDEGDETEANMRRIVTCVNALSGIDDPAAWVQRAKAAIAWCEACDRVKQMSVMTGHVARSKLETEEYEAECAYRALTPAPKNKEEQ